MKSGAIEGIQLIDNGSAIICNLCDYAKTTCKPIQKEGDTPLANAFGAEVHTDLWGPLPTPSLGGCKYYVTFIDDHTCYTSAKILCSKDQTLNVYKAYAAWAHTQQGAWIKQLCSDRGGEYTGTDFTAFLQGEGTEHWLTMHNTPQHNGVAEALNCQLVEHVHALLHQSRLPKTLWAEALLYTVWLKNCTLTCMLGTVMPYEHLHKSKPNLAGVLEWGQCMWVHNDSGSKLDAQAMVAHWVGYDADSTHVHRIYWLQKRSVSVEHNVKFTSDAGTIPISIPHDITMGTMPALPIPTSITSAPLCPPPVPVPAPAQVTSPPP